jgi:hypothetical protein
MAGTSGWGIALQAIGNLGEGIAGIIGGNQVAATQGRAMDRAQEEYNKYYGEAKGYQDPYSKMGMENTKKMNDMVNQDAFTDKEKFNFQQDPGYQNQLAQGNQSIQQNAGTMGNLFSGATMKALTKYGSNLANQQYQQAYGRYVDQRNFNQQNLNNQYGRYNNLSNMGINAANNLTNLTSEAGTQNAGFELGRGNIQAQRINTAVGNTQGVFKSIADVGGGMSGMGGGQDSGGGGGGGMGGYNTGLGGQGGGGGMLGNSSQLGNGNYGNLGMTYHGSYNLGSGYGGGQ